MPSHRLELAFHRHSSQSPWTYAELDSAQRKVAERVRSGGAGAVFLSEVAPVITYGRRTKPTDLLLSEAQLSARGVAIYPTDRGGLATYHGPGQWVLFVVDELSRLTGDSRGVRRAVEGLLEIARAAAAPEVPEAEIRWGEETGVWSRRGKLAAMGIHIEKRVLLHGIALNAYSTPESFQGLRPCGLDKPVDYLWAEPNPAEFEKLGQALVAEAQRVFGFVTS